MILNRLKSDGIAVRLNPDDPGRLLVRGNLSDDHRSLIRANRDELLWTLVPDDLKTETQPEPTEQWLSLESERLRKIEELIGQDVPEVARRIDAWLGALSGYEAMEQRHRGDLCRLEATA